MIRETNEVPKDPPNLTDEDSFIVIRRRLIKHGEHLIISVYCYGDDGKLYWAPATIPLGLFKEAYIDK